MRMAKIFTNFALSIPHLLLYIILTMSNVIHPLHTDIQPRNSSHSPSAILLIRCVSWRLRLCSITSVRQVYATERVGERCSECSW